MRPPAAGIVVDVETTGLDFDQDVLLEVGMVAVDSKLVALDAIQVVFSTPETLRGLSDLELLSEGGGGAKVVWDMHQRNGLTAQIRRSEGKGTDYAYGTQLLSNWLAKVGGVGLPMTGSSVAFDRRWLQKCLPEVESLFHYRNIDVSAVKEWIKMVAPDFWSEVADPARERRPARALHRSTSDCLDTLSEMRVYSELLLWNHSE